MANTVTISKKEYQTLKTKALTFENYLTQFLREKFLKDFEVSLEETGRYATKFIKNIVEAKKDVLEGNIKEISSLKNL